MPSGPRAVYTLHVNQCAGPQALREALVTSLFGPCRARVVPLTEPLRDALPG